jgi:hypothetical protein
MNESSQLFLLKHVWRTSLSSIPSEYINTKNYEVTPVPEKPVKEED